MKGIAIVLYCLLPVLVNAQERPYINFNKAGNWDTLLFEAKAEGKPIFIDAYATWCGPCKKMDREVFSDLSVSSFINQHFVAIRIQMDSTKDDSEFVRIWRKDIKAWQNYITAYPCFLFFTADGQLTDLEIGERSAQDFLAILKRTIDSNTSYTAQISKFRNGRLNKDEQLALAYRAKTNKDTNVNSIARSYKTLYLDPLPLDSLLKPEITKFAQNFYQVFYAGDRLIKYMNKYPLRIDSISKWNNFAMHFSDYFITRDYIDSQILPNGIPIISDPKWRAMHNKIVKDFTKGTADRVIINAKISWANQHKRYEEAIAYEFEKIDKYGLDTTLTGRGMFNNLIYLTVFPKVDNTALLKKAADLMKCVNEMEREQNSGYLDTYASILYKFGERAKALQVEEKALDLAKKRGNRQEIKNFTIVLERMKRGEEIWK